MKKSFLSADLKTGSEWSCQIVSHTSVFINDLQNMVKVIICNLCGKYKFSIFVLSHFWQNNWTLILVLFTTFFFSLHAPSKMIQAASSRISCDSWSHIQTCKMYFLLTRFFQSWLQCLSAFNYPKPHKEWDHLSLHSLLDSPAAAPVFNTLIKNTIRFQCAFFYAYSLHTLNNKNNKGKINKQICVRECDSCRKGRSATEFRLLKALRNAWSRRGRRSKNKQSVPLHQ